MQKQNLELNFEGQNIYAGIDVHLKSWTVTVLTEYITHKTFTQPPSAQILFNYLHENFPGATHYSAYEAGFSGYWTHYQLLSLGINNIVVNPANIPTTQKELFQKSDSSVFHWIEPFSLTTTLVVTASMFSICAVKE